MSKYLLISDAAKEVCVESHVLRYWEEELQLPIKRNELGHRYYTREDVERFKNIKDMKERGLQLKAIKMILRNNRLDVVGESLDKGMSNMGITDIEASSMEKSDVGTSLAKKQSMGGAEGDAMEHAVRDAVADVRGEKSMDESKEDKLRRLQWVMQQLVSRAVKENNDELVQRVKESVIKELDYQFRMQEEREEERAKKEAERTEGYYRRMDEILRTKSPRRSVKDIFRKEQNKDHNMLKKELK